MKWTRKKFMELFGEDPVDVLGNDWRNHIEEYEPLLNPSAKSQKTTGERMTDEYRRKS